MRPFLIRLSAIALLVASCGGSPGGRNGSKPVVFVAAAADLRYAFDEMKPAFEGECGCRLQLTYGSSGNFATQIEQGLPADVFFSADSAFVDRLQAKGLLLEDTRQLYAVGRIVVAKSKNAGGAPVTAVADLARPDLRRVAIANPEHAPYGVAAQEALTAAGVWPAVQPKLVLGENASQTAQFLESGDAQAGIIPLSLAIPLRDKLDYVLIDESQHTRLNQAAAVLKRSGEPVLARAFLAFVTGTHGREIMSKYGFQSPD